MHKMRIYLVAFCLQLIAVTTSSQNWNLFVLDQNSYYKQQYDDYAKVENFLLDSTLVGADKEVSYFNSKLNLSTDCDIDLKEVIDKRVGYLNDHKIDSLIKVGSSISLITSQSNELNTFLFKPHAKLNDSWVTNGITIKCSALEVQDVFGKQDSIKKFTCRNKGYDRIAFILSKTYGFLKFLPINEFFASKITLPYFELIGYSKDSLRVGYTQPKFSDYFHLKAGDMLFWEETRRSQNSLYYIDSITSSYITTDTVRYEYIQTMYDNQGETVSVDSKTRSHLQKIEGQIVENHTSSGVFLNSKGSRFYLFSLAHLYFKIEDNDTVTYAETRNHGVTFYGSDCTFRYPSDYSYVGAYSTKEGYFYEHRIAWGFPKTVIGSIINGEISGDITISTGIDDIKAETYKVYPNPFKDNITIEDPSNTISHIEIYNTLGNLILKHEEGNGNISLEGLPSGVYILKIIDKNKVFSQQKIIKR